MTESTESIEIRFAKLTALVENELLHMHFRIDNLETSLQPPSSQSPLKYDDADSDGENHDEEYVDTPKKPKNAYVCFVIEVRPSVILANPGVKNIEIVSIIAKQWQNTSNENREKYYQQAADDKSRYKDEMETRSIKNLFVKMAKKELEL
jgi:hypothetical protein